PAVRQVHARTGDLGALRLSTPWPPPAVQDTAVTERRRPRPPTARMLPISRIGWSTAGTRGVAMSDRVSVEIDGPLAHVTMTREDRLNGLDLAMLRGLVDAAAEVRADRSVRAVVL